MAKQIEMEVKVGLFVTIGIGLIMAAILVLGSTQSLFTRKSDYVVHFPNVEGLIEGSKVVLNGIQVGTVNHIAFDMQRRDIRVEFNVKDTAVQWVRKDSSVEIATQGVLGDKYVAVAAGTLDQPQLENGAELPYKPSKGLTQLLGQSDRLMVNLNNLVSSLDRLLKTFEAQNRSERFFEGMSQTAKNLSSASAKLDREMDELKLKRVVKNLDAIMEKINGGTGTVGALINDPTLYDNVKALVGQANRNRIVRNLVRQTIKDSEEKAAADEKAAEKAAPANKK